jgi:hypothetical protein
VQGNGAGKYVSKLLKACCASYVKGLAPHTLCLTLPDRRTFIEDYLKIVEFIEWLKDFYPEKAAFLKKINSLF